MVAAKFMLVFVQLAGRKEFGQLVQVSCPQEPDRLGGPDELCDVVVFDQVLPEDNGDPGFAATIAKKTEYHVRCGLSGLKRAKTIGDRVDGTWWPRAEDVAPTTTPGA